jgi:hypothetical protein
MRPIDPHVRAGVTRLLAAVAATAITLPVLVRADSDLACPEGQLCAQVGEMRMVAGPSKDSGCALHFSVPFRNEGYELDITLIAGEGTFLAYAIFEINIDYGLAGAEGPRIVPPYRASVTDADGMPVTDGWDTTVRARRRVLRKTILPEFHGQIDELAELIATDIYQIVIEEPKGRVRMHRLQPRSPDFEIARLFSRCAAETRAAVRPPPPPAIR